MVILKVYTHPQFQIHSAPAVVGVIMACSVKDISWLVQFQFALRQVLAS